MADVMLLKVIHDVSRARYVGAPGAVFNGVFVANPGGMDVEFTNLRELNGRADRPRDGDIVLVHRASIPICDTEWFCQ